MLRSSHSEKALRLVIHLCLGTKVFLRAGWKQVFKAQSGVARLRKITEIRVWSGAHGSTSSPRSRLHRNEVAGTPQASGENQDSEPARNSISGDQGEVVARVPALCSGGSTNLALDICCLGPRADGRSVRGLCFGAAKWL
jgi:hypothetical protein